MAPSGATERPQDLRGWLDWQEAFLDRLDDRAFLVDLSPTLELLRRPGPASEVLKNFSARLSHELRRTSRRRKPRAC